MQEILVKTYLIQTQEASGCKRDNPTLSCCLIHLESHNIPPDHSTSTIPQVQETHFGAIPHIDPMLVSSKGKYGELHGLEGPPSYTKGFH